MIWFNNEKEKVISNLDSSLEEGLSSKKANERLDKFGENQLQEESRRSFLSKLKDQFADFMVVILIIAAIISFLIGERTDSIVILIIVVLNAFLGIYQEGQAEKSLDALKKMASPTAKVIRDGQLITIESSKLVPGDIVQLDAGDIVPADLRLMDTSNLQIDESSLTGESIPVSKNSNLIKEKDCSLGDRKNMAYMSTIATYGKGLGIVVATGHDTEIGKIATEIQSFESETTPLQNKLNTLGKYLGFITIIICAIVFGVGLLKGEPVLDMFMVAVSLAVAAIPEGLPAIVTIVLALGMNRMVERHVIVKKLLAVETLGSTTVICSDKTGTLTQNKMTVVTAFANNQIIEVTGTGYGPEGEFLYKNKPINPDDNKELKRLLEISLLTNDAKIIKEDGEYKVIGDPTEGALVTLASKSSVYQDSLSKYPRIDDIPFDSARKMMTTLHKTNKDSKFISLTKGAPDIVIDRCSHIQLDGEILPFTEKLKDQVLKQNSLYAKSALRVLAFAYRNYSEEPSDFTTSKIEKDMVFVGLTGMIDPAREEVKDAIKLCDSAGITTVMITGDYKETAFAIAKELGIAKTEEQAVMGEEIENLSDEELQELVKTIRVFARVTPQHKVRIITAIKNNGHIAAMTGDGVNDAPALKKADIGIAMGITGTDVAKNTADLILTDDNFSSIVAAVEEGRIIYDNIVKFVIFLLSCNIGEVLIVFTSIMLGLEVPFLPIQLLWLNLVTDSFPALALGVEKGDPDIMSRSPRDPKAALLDREQRLNLIVQSIAIGFSSLAVYMVSLRRYGSSGDGLIMSRTMVFVTLILAELLRSYSSRSQKYTVFEIGIFSNKTLVLGTSFSFILMLLVIYVPFLQDIFHTVALNLKQWGLVLTFAFIPFIIGEAHKIIKRKK